ncbi:hypothetical protein Tco_0829550, partial [Tanacetum coccineum]
AQQYYPSQQHSQSSEVPSHYQQHKLLTIPEQPSVPHTVYPSPTMSPQPQAEFPQLDSGLVVPSFLLGDDPITSFNKAMAFLTTAIASRYPTTNNQLRTSSNPINQATIQDGRVTVQQVQGRQAQEVGQMLDEEQLAILADPGVVESQDTQPTVINNAAF